VLAPALLIAPFVAIDRAAAACDPPTPPADVDVVTCKGPTGSPGAPVGYGNGNLFANSITVLSGASVTGEIGLQFSQATVNNFGTISGGAGQLAFGILGTFVVVTNAGIITGADGIRGERSLTVMNSGIIAGTRNNLLSVGVFSPGVASVINSGTISAAGSNGTAVNADFVSLNNLSTGIIAGGAFGIRADGGSSIITSGAIIGLGSAAIFLSSHADSLTLLPGSRILGAIDMRGGNDILNFVSGRGVAQLVTLENFTGVFNISGVGPIVHSTDKLATLDSTAFGQADRTLLDFTGGVSSLVQSRLGGAPPNGSIQAVSYAPDGPVPNGLIRKAPFAGYAAPTVVWTGGFGGTRIQDATDETLQARSTVWGGLLGVDRQVRGDLLVGGFVGGGSGRLTADMSSQTVNTDYVGGGVYGRFDWASHFLDFTVQGGSAQNKSSRLVMSNLALATNGQETATARYNGWFVSPELTYGMRYAIGNGNMLTPFARVRYLAGIFDGYSELGSAQGLSVGRRTLQDVEERGEFELSKTASFGSEATMKTSLHGGVIALQRLGDTTINGVVIGQSFAFAAPGKDSTVGAVGGTGIDVTIGKSESVFGAVEGTVMSDKSRTATAKAGLRVGF
jgi:Autotransporter beta-domain